MNKIYPEKSLECRKDKIAIVVFELSFSAPDNTAWSFHLHPLVSVESHSALKGPNPAIRATSMDLGGVQAVCAGDPIIYRTFRKHRLATFKILQRLAAVLGHNPQNLFKFK